MYRQTLSILALVVALSGHLHSQSTPFEKCRG